VMRGFSPTMAQRWKRENWPRPAGIIVAGGILLFGVHLHRLVESMPATRVAPRELVAAALPQELGLPGPIGRAPAAEQPPATPEVTPRPAPVDPPVAGPLAPKLLPAPPLVPRPPLLGPEWKGGALPVFSPEVLRAMSDPRAARRARWLRSRGIVLQGETPPLTGPTILAPGAVETAPPKRGTEPSPTAAWKPQTAPTPSTRPAAPATVAASPKPGVKNTAHPEVTAPGVKMAARPALSSAPVPPSGAKPSTEVTTPPAGPEGAPAPVAEGPANSPATAPTPTGAAPASAPRAEPIRLQARLDRARPEYQVGEWVALRVLASQPAHLRVYRVDATGHVTRLFSTYDRAQTSRPARSFGMMLQAGLPRPGQERVVAIGSARPLTRDELLSCLRKYVADAPTENPVPSPAVAPDAPETGAAPDPTAGPLPLIDALQAVIDAVGRTGDLADGLPAPLERSSWSIAVGRFVSTPKSLQQSAVSGSP
jgi:hypothetical protein